MTVNTLVLKFCVDTLSSNQKVKEDLQTRELTFQFYPERDPSTPVLEFPLAIQWLENAGRYLSNGVSQKTCERKSCLPLWSYGRRISGAAVDRIFFIEAFEPLEITLEMDNNLDSNRLNASIENRAIFIIKDRSYYLNITFKSLDAVRQYLSFDNLGCETSINESGFNINVNMGMTRRQQNDSILYGIGKKELERFSARKIAIRRPISNLAPQAPQAPQSILQTLTNQNKALIEEKVRKEVIDNYVDSILNIAVESATQNVLMEEGAIEGVFSKMVDEVIADCALATLACGTPTDTPRAHNGDGLPNAAESDSEGEELPPLIPPAPLVLTAAAAAAAGPSRPAPVRTAPVRRTASLNGLASTETSSPEEGTAPTPIARHGKQNGDRAAPPMTVVPVNTWSVSSVLVNNAAIEPARSRCVLL